MHIHTRIFILKSCGVSVGLDTRPLRHRPPTLDESRSLAIVLGQIPSISPTRGRHIGYPAKHAESLTLPAWVDLQCFMESQNLMGYNVPRIHAAIRNFPAPFPSCAPFPAPFLAPFLPAPFPPVGTV